MFRLGSRFHSGARRSMANVLSMTGSKIGDITAPSLKTMVFMDGTWLYYSLVQGRQERSCPVARKFGPDWQTTHKIDWKRFPQIIASNLREQLAQQSVLSYGAEVDIIRTSVFTSLRADTEVGSPREVMVSNFYQSNFDVHKYETRAQQEKCVDISLAVEMLFMATIPSAYDIAVIVTGDKDFIPALQKTRLLGKRVAIVSFRNSVNPDLIAPDARTKDFNVIWVDDYLDHLVVPIVEGKLEKDRAVSKRLLEVIPRILSRSPNSAMTSNDVGRELQTHRMEGTDLLTLLKESFGGLKSFLERHPALFRMHFSAKEKLTFTVSLATHAPYGTLDAADSDEEGGEDNESEGEDVMSDGKPSGGSLRHSKSAPSETSAATATKLKETLLELVNEAIGQESSGRVNSRDIGRMLQSTPSPIEGCRDALSALKTEYRSLQDFFETHSSQFVLQREWDKKIGGFWVSARGSGGGETAASSQSSGVSDDQAEALFSGYGGGAKSWNSAGRDVGTTSHSSEASSTDVNADIVAIFEEDVVASGESGQQADDASSPPSDSSRRLSNYEEMKVAELKAVLKGLGLSAVGNKKELIERLHDSQRSALYDWSKPSQ